MTLTEWIHN